LSTATPCHILKERKKKKGIERVTKLKKQKKEIQKQLEMPKSIRNNFPPKN